jgi:nicotinamide-nucleotide amidase
MYPIESVINFLREHKLQLVTAESCTSGMVTSLLADIPGCGAVLDAGYVVYTENAKNACLGVTRQTMKLFGLTSEEVATEMAIGALERSAGDIAVAITGTAESNDELNGVVCFAYATRIDNEIKTLSETIKFEGERNQVRKLASIHVISSIPIYYKKFIKGEGEIYRNISYSLV